MTLNGWVHRRRDHGGLIFVDLRDRSGLVQIVFSPQTDAEAYDMADTLRSEYVVAVKGTVRRRAARRGKSGPAHGPDRGGRPARRDLEPGRIRCPSASTTDVDVDEAVRLRHRVPGSAAAGDAAEHHPAPPSRQGGAGLPRRRRASRNRDADADPQHARGRPRLPGAQPRASRQLLRPAAVAAALQAAADGRRASSATSRSRAASATRTCGPTASRSSRRSTWRCRSSTARTCWT